MVRHSEEAPIITTETAWTARWVNNQRYRRKSGQMPRERETRLMQIDFIWRSKRKQVNEEVL